MWNIAWTLTAHVWSHSASSISSIVSCVIWYAALLTTTSRPAELGDRPEHQVAAVLRVGDVAGEQEGRAAGGLDQLRRAPCVLLLLAAQVGDRDVGALAGEGDGDRASDA
jgi:hypothetical protein